MPKQASNGVHCKPVSLYQVINFSISALRTSIKQGINNIITVLFDPITTIWQFPHIQCLSGISKCLRDISEYSNPKVLKCTFSHSL